MKLVKLIILCVGAVFLMTMPCANVFAESSDTSDTGKTTTLIDASSDANATDDTTTEADTTIHSAVELSDTAQNQLQDIAALTGATALVVKALAEQNLLSARDLKAQAEAVIVTIR